MRRSEVGGEEPSYRHLASSGGKKLTANRSRRKDFHV